MPCTEPWHGSLTPSKGPHGTYGGLELGRSEVRRIKAEEKGKLLAARKLVLVLDLDHTLLNSAVYHELTPEMRAKHAFGTLDGIKYGKFVEQFNVYGPPWPRIVRAGS